MIGRTSNSKRIKASEKLKRKIGTGQIDDAKILAAQKVIDENDVDFREVANPDLKKLQKAIDAARQTGCDSSDIVESFKVPIMNLKANAGTFHYKFISDLTSMVLLLFEGYGTPDRKLVQIADVLHKTILLALAYQMKGDGGANGKALVAAFEEICKKCRK